MQTGEGRRSVDDQVRAAEGGADVPSPTPLLGQLAHTSGTGRVLSRRPPAALPLPGCSSLMKVRNVLRTLTFEDSERSVRFRHPRL